jgi:Skp family chaperone for outer membrane proteins
MEVPMEGAMDVDTAAQEAMGKAIMAEMQQQTLRSIRQAVRQELLEEVHAEAIEAAKVELQDDFDRRRERLLDDLARQRRQLEDELDNELERREQALRQEIMDALEERLLTLQDDLQAAVTERDRAEGLLVQLITQLLPGERPVYLHSAGVREFDRWQTNQTLARHNLQVRSKTTYSERIIKTRLDQERYASHTQFWVTPLPVAGVVDEDVGAVDQAEGHTS